MDQVGMENKKQQALKSRILDLLDLSNDEKYVDCMVNFVHLNGTELLKYCPPVRINFGSQLEK